jgi:hypothetical protein
LQRLLHRLSCSTPVRLHRLSTCAWYTNGDTALMTHCDARRRLHRHDDGRSVLLLQMHNTPQV